MWSEWKRLFQERASRPLPPIPETIDLPPRWRAPVARSLARFQIGEGGEGRIANEIRRVQLASIDDDYRDALRLFVREEGRHARILGTMVRALGGELCRETWTERLFVRGRRLAGVRLKLLVLLAAEVVGIGFYGQLAGALDEGPLRDALLQITGDEEDHLRFHVDFFQRSIRGSRGRRALFTAVWLGVASLACGLVVLDHRQTLAVTGIGPRDAARDYRDRILAVLRATLATEAPLTSARGRPAAKAKDCDREPGEAAQVIPRRRLRRRAA